MKRDRYQHYDPEWMPFRVSKPRKDYGQEFPVQRRRQRKAVLLMLASGCGAIFFFFAALLVTFHLLPCAIEAELQRQVEVVERSIGITQQ